MNFLLILLPIATGGVLTLLSVRSTRASAGLMEAIVRTHLIVFVFIAVSTELLSAFQAIAAVPVIVAWIVFLGLATVSVRSRLPQSLKDLMSPPGLRIDSPLYAVLGGSVVLILAVTFATALLYPPNNFDSMTYHLPRVAHWIQNGQVAHYPTAIIRQIYLTPLAEFAILHLQLLTGGDFFANLVQWASFPVLICLGFLIGAELGLNDRRQFLAAVTIATLPMAILQASSTQNDLVASSFIMAFALYMLRLRQRLSFENSIPAAVSLGLAMLTKPTGNLYCAALGLCLGFACIWEYRRSRARLVRCGATLILVPAAAMILNCGHYYRNYALFGNPFYTEVQQYMNQDRSPQALLANVVRNISIHLAVPSQPINQHLVAALESVFGAELNNPKSTVAGTSFHLSFRRHEDFAGNLIHMVFVLASAIALPILWFKKRFTETITYTCALLGCTAFYSIIMQWQPWASRLHTPLFVLAAPLMAIPLSASFPPDGVRRYVPWLAVFLLALYCLLFAFANSSRSLISLRWLTQYRQMLYFENRPHLYQDYHQAAAVIKGAQVKQAGLYLNGDDWEYPFWVFLKGESAGGGAIRLKHVGVLNASRKMTGDTSLPEYVLATSWMEAWIHSRHYIPVFKSANVWVFKKRGTTHFSDLELGFTKPRP